MPAAAAQSELRLVLLGQTGSGNRSTISAILGLQDCQLGTEAEEEESSKHRGEAAGRQVVVISSPAWFSSSCEPQQRRRHISSFLASSSPGPHAFLLSVAVNQPAEEESRALDVLEAILGPSAVRSNTIVLFTHTEELEEDEQLEQYLATWRKDLGELVRRCGDRYHTLETRGGAEEKKAVEELLLKVEQTVAESGEQHFSSPLYQEAEARVRERQEEMVRQRRASQTEPPAQQEEVAEAEMEAVRDQAERSIAELDVDVESFFPSAVASPAAPSLLWGLWEKLSGWLRWLPTVVRREALLGALVGLFVGGPYGGMMGATVGSVATEVKRRRTQKIK